MKRKDTFCFLEHKKDPTEFRNVITVCVLSNCDFTCFELKSNAILGQGLIDFQRLPNERNFILLENSDLLVIMSLKASVNIYNFGSSSTSFSI